MFSGLHPSPTAGDGKAILQGKYHYPTDRPELPVRCAMCGFINDMDRTQQGDTLLTPGIKYNGPVTATVKLPAYNGVAQVSFSDTTIEPVVISGCAFCGSFNEYGRYVGDEFGTLVDIANQ